MTECTFIKIAVSAVTVWVKEGKKDRVIIQTDAPSPERSNSKENFTIQFEIGSGKGKDYVEKWFGVKPLVIDEMSGKVIQNFLAKAEQSPKAEVSTPIISVVKNQTIEEQAFHPANTSKEKVGGREDFFYQPKAEKINSWKAVIYNNEFYTIYGMDKGEWFPFLNKATGEEVLTWFRSKGKDYGGQVLADAINAG